MASGNMHLRATAGFFSLAAILLVLSSATAAFASSASGVYVYDVSPQSGPTTGGTKVTLTVKGGALPEVEQYYFCKFGDQPVIAEHYTIGEDGVGTFVCLQAEVPPQYGSVSLGGTRVEPLPGLEPYAEDALAAKPEEPPTFVHFGIEDMKPADDIVALRGLVYSLVDRVRAGEVLYVHCWGGKGRAGLVCACLLACLYDIGAEEALTRVQVYVSLRNQGLGATLKSPETEEQKQQVRDFIRLSRASDCVEE